MTTLLAFAFVLGVLVFVHELGHFLMARWHGVKVLTFSLAFGPKLLKVKRGDTEYAVSAIPLGFIAMHGARFGVTGVTPPLRLPGFVVCAIAPKVAMMDTGIVWLFEALEAAARIAHPSRRQARTRR